MDLSHTSATNRDVIKGDGSGEPLYSPRRAMIVMEYGGRPGALVFPLGDRRPQRLELSNVAPAQAALLLPQAPVVFKIQCTSSKKFRVRPILGIVVPGGSTQVELQLAPQEREPAECKFLVVVRSVPASFVLEAATNQDLKATWQRVESLDSSTLLFSETITASIVSVDKQACDPATGLAPTASNAIITSEVAGVSQRKAATANVTVTIPPQSLADKAQLVLLLVKNESRAPCDQLTPPEKTLLRRLRDEATSDWLRLHGYAVKLRQTLSAAQSSVPTATREKAIRN